MKTNILSIVAAENKYTHPKYKVKKQDIHTRKFMAADPQQFNMYQFTLQKTNTCIGPNAMEFVFDSDAHK